MPHEVNRVRPGLAIRLRICYKKYQAGHTTLQRRLPLANARDTYAPGNAW